MIEKPLIIVSLVTSFFGFSAENYNQKIADFYNRDSYSKAEAESIGPAPPELQNLPIVSSATKPAINAKFYALIDYETGAALIEKKSTEKTPIASTTKIMTAIVALENYNLDDVVTISEKAAYQPGADAYLRVGEKITVSELLHCMLIKSGNDSAYALAEFMDKSDIPTIESFVDKMNIKAEEFGLSNSNFRDPVGLDVSGYSTAADMAQITRYALQNATFRKIVSTSDYVATSVDKTAYHQLHNSNRLVAEYQYPGAIGVKTGFMPEASHSLVGAATRNGHTLIAAVYYTYADTATASADETKKLLDWGFEYTKWDD